MDNNQLYPRLLRTAPCHQDVRLPTKCTLAPEVRLEPWMTARFSDPVLTHPSTQPGQAVLVAPSRSGLALRSADPVRKSVVEARPLALKPTFLLYTNKIGVRPARSNPAYMSGADVRSLARMAEMTHRSRVGFLVTPDGSYSVVDEGTQMRIDDLAKVQDFAEFRHQRKGNLYTTIVLLRSREVAYSALGIVAQRIKRSNGAVEHRILYSDIRGLASKAGFRSGDKLVIPATQSLSQWAKGLGDELRTSGTAVIWKYVDGSPTPIVVSAS